MKIEQFRFLEVGATKKAEVLVTTGHLWWKRTQRKRAFLPQDSIYWRWSDTGDFAPTELRDLALAAEYDPTNGKPLG